MEKYRVNRTFYKNQFQIVEAESEEEAEEIALDNEGNFQDAYDSDYEWQYETELYK